MANRKFLNILWYLLKGASCISALALTVCLIFCMLQLRDRKPVSPVSHDQHIMDDFDTFVSASLLDARQGALSVKKRYWIPEGSEPPARDDAKYGTASSAAELQWLLDEASPLFDGQEMAFSTEIEIRSGTEITYYLDESIFAITWQQVINRIVYTISEVKISDASQLRRHLANGYYVSQSLYPTTTLAKQAGAVIAVSGDHFRGRNDGIVVYEGEVKRFTGEYNVDSCFIDPQGNLILKPRGSFQRQAELETFLKENKIRFSVSFGPAVIIDGERSVPKVYALGEINDGYPRCAIAQKDNLHYMLFAVNGSGSNYHYPTISEFTDEIEKFNVRQAYCLDGGQTGAIAMQDRLMNPNEYKTGQRYIGDIICFVTAIQSEK